MAIYAIHAPEPGDPSRGLEDVRAVRSGFSIGALLFGPLWLLLRGLWLEFFVYVLLAAAIVVAGVENLLTPGAVFWLFVLGELYLGFEGAALRAAALTRGGRPLADVVLEEGAAGAERSFIARALSRIGAGPRPNAASRAESGILGLFPEKGR